MPDANRPVLLFYCQHSLGIGHLTRSLALADALSRAFRIVFLNGGPLPPGVHLPTSILRIDLPPLGMDDGHSVVSRDANWDLAAARAERVRLIELAVARHPPAVVLVELFPFGRKKFTGEILAMLRAAKRSTEGRARVVCSVRDILVDARRDQQLHDDRARWLADRYFDAVLVHSDPALASLDESFRPSKRMRSPVHYTGYVVPARAVSRRNSPRRDHVLVSAGGGIVGASLFDCALRAQSHLRDPLPMRIVAGPFLPESEWCRLAKRAAKMPNVRLIRQVPDMVDEMRDARVSISQCGYNTALDIAVAGVPALVVPYEVKGENEQRNRAERLARLGAVRMLPASELQPQALARSIEALLQFRPQPLASNLDGARRTASIIENLCAAKVASEAACSMI